MYNELRKLEYRNTLTGSEPKNEFSRICSVMQPFEELLEKDFSQFTREETIQAINSAEQTSPFVVKTYLLRARQYQIAMGELDSSLIVPIAKEEIDFVTPLRKYFFKSFADVVVEITKVRPLDGGHVEPPLLGLAWIGVEPKHAGKILASEIDLKRGVLSSKDYNITFGNSEPEVLGVFRSFRNISKAYRSTTKSYEVHPEDSPYFVRRMLSDNSSKKAKPYLSTDISRIFGDLKRDAKDKGVEINLSYGDILRSGQLNRVYQKERTGDIMTSFEFKQLLCSTTGVSMSHFSDIFYQYKQYKLAFNL